MFMINKWNYIKAGFMQFVTRLLEISTNKT